MIRPLLTYKDQSAAQAVATKLTEGEIPANVREEKDKVKTLYVVDVDEPHHAGALEAIGESELAESAVHCPGCSSINVEFPARPRASGLVSAMNTLADTVVPPEEKGFQCRNCRNEWN